MTQFSYPWPGVAPADGVDAGPYTAAQWWERVVALLSSSGTAHGAALVTDIGRENIGVLVKVGNLLAVTNPANHDIQIDTGVALVDGAVVYNDAALTLTIPLPVANPRIDRIVIRKNYTAAQYDPAGDAGDEEVPAYTARITRLVGVENAIPVAPALTQDATRATYWDIPLAQFQLSVGGVVTGLTSETEYAPGWDDDHHSPDVAYGVYHPLYRTIATGAIQADTSGNARGTEAVDLQQERTLATQVASGSRSFIAGGNDNTASGQSSFAANYNNQATGIDSAAFGSGSIASGLYAFAEGAGSEASGTGSHAEGKSDATGVYAHAEGDGPDATGRGSHAEGSNTLASQTSAHAEGAFTTASGIAAHAEGTSSTASGTDSHAEGYGTVASGSQAHAEGNTTTAEGDYSHAAGRRAKTGANNGVFIWADSEDADFTADRADQFKVRASGGTHLVQNAAAAALPVLELEQNDDNEPFIEFDGTSAADQTKSISTVNGDGAVTGPKNFSSTAGWEFVGMVRISINGNDYWMPYYQPDTA